MKIEITPAKAAKKKTYPWLGISRHSGVVVLFVKQNAGIALEPSWAETAFEDKLDEVLFEPWAGSVTLSNN